MRLETLDTSMRREQTKAEAVARLMASFASHLQAAVTDTAREKDVHTDTVPSPHHQQADRQPSAFFADLQPHHDTMTVQPKVADPVRPTDTEQHPAASASATAQGSAPEFTVAAEPHKASQPLQTPQTPRPEEMSVSPAPAVAPMPAAAVQSATSSVMNASPPSAPRANGPAATSTPGAHTANASAEPGNAANATAQKATPATTPPADVGKAADAEASASTSNTQAAADLAATQPTADAKGVDTIPVSAAHVAVAAKGMKSVAEHAAHGDDASEAPAPGINASAATVDSASRAVNPDVATMTGRAAATAAAPPEAAPVAPVSSAPSANVMAIGARPRAGASQPAEAEVAGDARPTSASAKAGTPDAATLDGADAIIRPHADGGLLVTLAPSANGPVQVKLDVAGGSVSNLVFIAPYQQTRNHLETLRPAIAAATRGGASVRIQSSCRGNAGASQESRAELPGDASDHPHVDVKI